MGRMSFRIFVAGGSGAVGRRLLPLLCEAGHAVAATTRSAQKTAVLRALGAEPVLVDVFKAAALSREVASFRPDVVVHQLTDLPPALDPAGMAAALPRNARLRDEGTRNLVKATIAAGARQIIAQSILWAYAPGPEPHSEVDPLDRAADGARGISVRGVVALEHHVLSSPPLQGAVLRYGHFYGPGTGFDRPRGVSPLHVDAAAHAALLAVEKNARGVFNIAEPNAYADTIKAASVLGWDAAFRYGA
jgi:nucleoside-diphosphate-sugar epimerase